MLLLRHFRNRRSDKQRGATIIEAAIVTPLFLMLIFGIFEFGFLLRNYLVVSGATGAATRAAAVSGSDPDADYLMIRTFEHGLGSASLEDLEVLVIYKASGPEDPVPPGCLTTPIAAGLKCNRYTAADFFVPYVDSENRRTEFWGCGDVARDRNWCPLDRESSIAAGPDTIGVYAELSHHYLTGLFGKRTTINVTKTSRIEASEN